MKKIERYASVRLPFFSTHRSVRESRKRVKVVRRQLLVCMCVYIYIHNREIRCPWKRQAAYRRTRLHREIACAGDQIIVGAFSLIRFPATSHKRPPAFTFACALAFTSRLGFARNHARSLIREHLKEIKSLVEEKSDLHDRKWLFEKKDVKLSDTNRYFITIIYFVTIKRKYLSHIKYRFLWGLSSFSLHITHNFNNFLYVKTLCQAIL